MIADLREAFETGREGNEPRFTVKSEDVVVVGLILSAEDTRMQVLFVFFSSLCDMPLAARSVVGFICGEFVGGNKTRHG